MKYRGITLLFVATIFATSVVAQKMNFHIKIRLCRLKLG